MIDGRACESVPASDRGLQYGDGLFETMAAGDGRIALLEDHLERLSHGAGRLGLPIPDLGVLRREVLGLLPDQGKAVIKLILTRGSGGRGYRQPEKIKIRRIVSLHPWPDYPDSWASDGIQVRLCETRLANDPVLAGLKTLNRLHQVLARAEWDDPNIAEGLMMDADGRVVCGTMSNLFLVRSGVLLTPDLEYSGVAGVMRKQILKIAAHMEIEVQERAVTVDDLWRADEIFVSNSLIMIWPVRQLDDHVCATGPLTTRLQHALKSSLSAVGATP
ncbi:MAG: aminodeoxychorismate lyase [Proteobacteria bacterium]|nr:aminodeoxychorismate lyase [Pseudomonadota bacterium]